MYMLQEELPKKINESLKKLFSNTYKFCRHDINKFIYCYQKMFTLISILITGENSMKKRYQEKKIFIVF